MSRSVARLVRDLRRHMKLRQGDLAAQLNVTQSTISRWESGQDVPTFAAADSLAALARRAGLDTRPYLQDAAPNRDETPLVGYVGAGAEIVPFGNDERLEYLDAPPGISAKAVAVQVRGDSMAPSYRDGAILFYDAVVDPNEMIGRECVVHLSDGRKFVRILTRGSQPRTFSLISTNGAPVLDVMLDGASRIVWIKPAL